MKKIFLIVFVSMMFITSCDNSLEQVPPNIANADSLTDFTGVLNAAYYYQTAAGTPLAVMGDFRADNAIFDEAPHNSFQVFNGDLITLEGDFFQPFYANLYKSILSANNVIENSTNATHIAEAKFLRGLAYFNLVKVFGDIPVNLSASPSTTDTSILAKQPVADVYKIVIDDFTDAINGLDNSGIITGRASKLAAQGMLGKTYIFMGDFTNAETHLKDVINGAAAAGVSLQDNFADVFGSVNDLNSEIIFATQTSGAITAGSGTVFAAWFGGNDTKADEYPITSSLVDAFDAEGDVTRKDATILISATNRVGVKFDGADQDFIDLRLGDAILLYAEALNENNKTSDAIIQLNKIRNRANLANTTATTKATVKVAIANERRLELAFEGHRWFDLVRTNTVSAEMGTTVDSKYYVFPIPTSEIFASDGIITQNTGY
ncbi:Starch-binding associating with outer membrane [Polaribacter sp. KT25b]|uniref:RagB/SusD family nutrient uptake outer membrane protein n=1 Tax=Polaribacter sp. KT25b TaxID=1855336 RepID=UPI00087A8097|nr:RagB/SusD family nutrient uptake outer membrane protein [Polaribacter sp. KT25b]SDS57659.1 Starch-binding associating with outer membrane [Polaribacter sp. KT25b]